jgi:hypothetical protein
VARQSLKPTYTQAIYSIYQAICNRGERAGEEGVEIVGNEKAMREGEKERTV